MRIGAAFLADPALRRVVSALESGGYRGLVVGGAVRNAVLRQPVGDVDIATDAPPGRITELAQGAGLKTVPTGIAHGTVTVIAGGTPFEVTTFRRDVETDGRRAVVAFSDRIEDDAARRDFTMNALYATLSGEVLDPVGGWPDLRRRELRFVGDPTARIREDYLRILRFFRFLAWYAHRSAPGTLEAVCAERAGLARVSAERIGAEMRKLLAAPDPAPVLDLMARVGVLGQILPGADPGFVAPLVQAETAHAIAPDWRRRLFALGPDGAAQSLRLSRAEANYLRDLHAATAHTLPEAAYRHGAQIARDLALIRQARGAPPPPSPPGPGWPHEIARAAAAALPVAASDLMPHLSGPELGRGLKAAEDLWIASDFSAPRAALIDAARRAGKENA